MALLVAVGAATVAVLGMSVPLSAVMLAAGEAHITQNTLFAAMALLCGFTFPTSYLPDPARWLGEALPVTWALRVLRAATLPGADADAAPALAVCLLLGGVYLLFGLSILGPAERRALQRAGSHECRHRHHRPAQGLPRLPAAGVAPPGRCRGDAGRGRVVADHSGRSGDRAAGPQRRREDHDDPDPVDAAATDVGHATVDGLDVVADAREVRRRINVIAGGERMVYSRLTARENLWYFGQLYDVPRARLRSRIDELLSLVGLVDAADTPVERYSRGMRQRLVIARGLINDPAYLLLDEPTLGLDAPIARELRVLVADLAAGGVGVLLTSHYLAEVEQLCRHVLRHRPGWARRAGQPGGADRAGRPAAHGAGQRRRRRAGGGRGGGRRRRRRGADLGRDVDDDGRDRFTLRHPEDLAGERRRR